MDTLAYYIEEKLFTGKNVMVTGSTGGIGSEVVESLLRCGARVIAVVRNEAKARDKFDKLSICLCKVRIL
jgi:NAD(P)-dependent dehydrogenase (short-subunit alcohol dehydrogenase family)